MKFTKKEEFLKNWKLFMQLTIRYPFAWDFIEFFYAKKVNDKIVLVNAKGDEIENENGFKREYNSISFDVIPENIKNIIESTGECCIAKYNDSFWEISSECFTMLTNMVHISGDILRKNKLLGLTVLANSSIRISEDIHYNAIVRRLYNSNSEFIGEKWVGVKPIKAKVIDINALEEWESKDFIWANMERNRIEIIFHDKGEYKPGDLVPTTQILWSDTDEVAFKRNYGYSLVDNNGNILSLPLLNTTGTKIDSTDLTKIVSITETDRRQISHILGKKESEKINKKIYSSMDKYTLIKKIIKALNALDYKSYENYLIKTGKLGNLILIK